MMLLPLAAAPGMTVAAAAVERRFGSSAGGWLGAAPITICVSALAVAAEAGDPAAAALAGSAAAQVVAQVAFGAGFALVLRAHGPARGFAAGLAAYVAVSIIVALAGPVAAVATAPPALALGARLLPARLPAGAGPGPSAVVAGAAGAAAVFALVAGALSTAAVAGPGAAGIVAALPLQSGAFALLMTRHRGRPTGAAALRGMILGLPAYLGFSVALALLAGPAGAIPATALAVAVALGVSSTTWRCARGPVAPHACSTMVPHGRPTRTSSPDAGLRDPGAG